MGPKKKEIIDESYWRKIIEEAVLNDNDQTVQVVIIEAAESDYEETYIKKFEIFATKEKRFVVKNISKSEITFMVNLFGVEKYEADENLRVFREAFTYIRDNEEIPSDIVALIVKHILIQMKNQYTSIDKAKIEMPKFIQKEIDAKLDRLEIKDITLVHTSPFNASVINIDEFLSKKYNTLLRNRGEEWRDRVYVDDYPVDGPSFYVAITGFTDPYLAGCLTRISVPLKAIVQIRIDPLTAKPPSTISFNKNVKNDLDFSDKFEYFWNTLETLRINHSYSEDYKNIAFVVFSPPYDKTEKIGDAESIYDELCYLMYDVQDLSRQHFHYLQNIEVINVPTDNPEPFFTDLYLRYIKDIPLECITVYSILDKVIQVISEEENLSLVREKTLSRVRSGKKRFSRFSEDLSKHQCRSKSFQSMAQNSSDNEKAQRVTEKVFTALSLSDTMRKKYRLSYGEELRNKNEPKIIDFGNSMSQNLFHLENIEFENALCSMLLGMPIHKLWKTQKKEDSNCENQSDSNLKLLLLRLQEEAINILDLEKIFYVLSCKKLYENRSTIKKRHIGQSSIHDFKRVYMNRSVLAGPIPKNNVLSSSLSSLNSASLLSCCSKCDCEKKFCSFDYYDICDAINIVRKKPKEQIINNFDYFEKFKIIDSFQTLLEAFNKFNFVDYKYCYVTDCIFLMFFNSHEGGMSCDEWRSHIQTPVCLQDFFIFDFDDHYDWIKREENFHDSDFMMNSHSKETSNMHIIKSCIDNLERCGDFLLEGSLKYQEMMSKVSGEVSESVPTKQVSAATVPSRPFDSRTSNKSKNLTCTTPTDQLSDINVCLNNSDSEIEKPFKGFDLGDRRVEAFGKGSTYFFKDGTKVLTQYYMLIPMDIEYIELNINFGNGVNEFWIHKPMGDYIPEHLLDIDESFRITTKDKMIINIYKQSYFAPLIEQSNFYDEFAKDENCPLAFYENNFYSFSVTWPNGLITESVHETNSHKISHIKQFYVQSKENLCEDMRCVNFNGEVIIFKNSGDIDVLSPDGSFITIKKCEKIALYEEFALDYSKSKSSVSKTVSKPQKKSVNEKINKSEGSMPTNDPKHVINKNSESELEIQEFEFIESNGQKWQYSNGVYQSLNKLLMSTMSDYYLGEISRNRTDGTSIFLDSNGVQITTFLDKTRIISKVITEENEIYISLKNNDGMENFNNDTKLEPNVRSEEDSRNDGFVSVIIKYIVEHINFPTLTIDRFNGSIKVESPNNNSIVIDNENNCYDMTLGSRTKSIFDGKTLHISYNACLDSVTTTATTCNDPITCDIRISSNNDGASNTKSYWLNMSDSNGNKVFVNDEGKIFNDKLDNEEKSSVNQNNINGNSNENLSAKDLRFFLLNRDLTSEELINRDVIEHYISTCSGQSWCVIDKPLTKSGRQFLSILDPIHLNESEKWLMESQYANAPHYITQVKNAPNKKNKGFYHWMRPYDRFEPKPTKVPNVFPDRHPRAFIHRLLECQEWKEKNLQLTCANDTDKNCRTSSSSSVDYNILNSQSRDEEVEKLRNKIYEDLKDMLLEDTIERTKPTITTEPFIPGLSGPLEKPREKVLPKIPRSPNLDRYWRRRKGEAEQEQFHKQLLRDSGVPNYFGNILGGALWWEVNHTWDTANVT